MRKIAFFNYSITNQKYFKFLWIFVFVLFSSLSISITADNRHEKVYIHFDKSAYYAGESIWFKTYLINAVTHSAETFSKVVYVELISPNNEIIETSIIKINEGGGEGNFKLSVDLVSGEYTVRAYTNFMRNFSHSFFFRKKVDIKVLRPKKNANKKLQSKSTENNKPVIHFFPEGGHLVSGVLNRVGFKALDANGYGIDLEGTITDSEGKKISPLKTSKFGMGKVEFTPETNKVYKAIITHEDGELTYHLPVVLKRGVIMKIIEHNDYYGVYLQSSLDKGLDNFNFIGSQRKGVIFKANISGNEAKGLIKVPKNILEEGIVQFTLFDNNNKPISERLSFYEKNEPNVNILITPSKQQYETRELVELTISLDANQLTKSRVNMSIAVTDMATVKEDLHSLDIKSQLLLNSELKGTIEYPGYYFNSDDPQRKSNLDLLMMTQGWRQFIINDTLNKQSTPSFIVESGIDISGNVKSFNNHKKSAIAEVSISYKNNKEFGYEELITDDQGHFIFKNLNFIDTTSVIIQAKKIKKENQRNEDKKQAMNFYIEIDSFIAPKIYLKQKQDSKIMSEDMGNSSSMTSKYLESLYEYQKGSIKLDEVTIESPYLNRNTLYHKKRILYKEPSQTIDFKDIVVMPTGNALSALQGRVAGLSVRMDVVYLRAASSLLGNNRALLLLDGIPIENDGQTINMIPISEIDFVDVLKGPRAAIYGSRAANGVVAVYTLSNSKKPTNFKVRKRRGITDFFHPGYSQARKFYEPTYEIENKEDDRSDYRSTLYWNPTIKLNKDGKTTISFYTSDALSSYRVILEGITLSGQIIRTEAILNQ